MGIETAVIRRVLHRDSTSLPESNVDTAATIAVMARVLPPARVLISASRTSLRDSMLRRLEGFDFEIDVARDESDALRRSSVQLYQIVLTDSSALIRHLRKPPQDRYIFILRLVGDDAERERLDGFRAGADDCIGDDLLDVEFRARIHTARRITELETLLRTSVIENRKLASTDDLTGLANRRFFAKTFPSEAKCAARHGKALSLIMCDIDHFKKVNDTYGHAAGDLVLKEMGARMRGCLRRGVDWAARLGGEEFAIVLPEVGYEQALEVARRLRASVGSSPFAVDGKKIAVTVSLGVCSSDPVLRGERKVPERMFKVADQALYRSKNGGRNRVTGVLLPPAASPEEQRSEARRTHG